MAQFTLKPISSFLQPLRSKYPDTEIQSTKSDNVIVQPKPHVFEHDYDEVSVVASQDEHSYSLMNADRKLQNEIKATRILKNLRPVKPLTECQLITRIEKKSFNPRVSKAKIYPKVGDVCNFQHDYEMASCLQEVEVQISRLMKARVILNLTQSQFSEYLATNYGVSLQQNDISKLEKRDLSLKKAQSQLKMLGQLFHDLKDTDWSSIAIEPIPELTRKRTVYPSHYLELFNELFEINAYPHRIELHFLSRFVLTDRERLREWFSAKRMKMDKKSRLNLKKGNFDLWKEAVYKWDKKWNKVEPIIEEILEGTI